MEMPKVTGGAAGSKTPNRADYEKALRKKGPDYVPRTEHLLPNNEPKYINRLIFETSPYLLQHAHNPVDWHPWGKEAFAKAQAEDKLVFLSVGYSTCHWCHVMERESFEDEEVAAYLNKHFICIKVDREERPDIDSIYMTAVRMMSRRGGWPMTVVLTPDKLPVFGGTYFPPRDGDRGARYGLLSVLASLLARKKADNGAALVEYGQAVAQKLSQVANLSGGGDVPTKSAIFDAAKGLTESFDKKHGGFGDAPKFPRSVDLELLARYHRRSGDQNSLQMLDYTLTKMARGGMYDHIGGGFHRYSTDERWLIPHFEKMLYDNAQLAVAYIEGYQLTGDKAHAEIARDILDYVAREMQSERGGFYSATDADSVGPGGESEEGYYFSWTPAEIDLVLGGDEAKAVKARFGITPVGNFENGRTVLSVVAAPSAVAKKVGVSETEVIALLNSARQKLYAQRSKRAAPLRDDKIITSWNGLMLSALARWCLANENTWTAPRAPRSSW